VARRDARGSTSVSSVRFFPCVFEFCVAVSRHAGDEPEPRFGRGGNSRGARRSPTWVISTAEAEKCPDILHDIHVPRGRGTFQS